MKSPCSEILSDSEYEQVMELRENAMKYYFEQYEEYHNLLCEHIKKNHTGMFSVTIKSIMYFLDEFQAWSRGNLAHCVEFIRDKDNHLITYNEIKNYGKEEQK